jgi:murein L,D-transpeptidase YafK
MRIAIIAIITIFTVLFWINLSTDSITKGTSIDSIVVSKHTREMIVYSNKLPVKTYKIALGRHPRGKKRFEGDMKTPEGIYHINDRNPNSDYHKNLGISYPNDADKRFAAANSRRPGGDVKIHGLQNGRSYVGKLHRLSDWTQGCIAVTDAEIDELYAHVKPGTPINILP